MTESFEIVGMNAGHLDEITRMETLCFSCPWSYESLKNELTNPVAVYFIAEFDGRPVGYAGMHYVLDEGYIANIAVHPDFRCRGIATALMERLDAFAHDKALAMLSLEVRVSNSGAIRIYEKSGYQRVGVRRGFYEKPREDAYIMTKILKDTQTGVQP